MSTGATPSASPGAAESALRHSVIPTALGDLTLVLDGAHLLGIYYPGHWTRPERASAGREVPATEDPLAEATRTQLADYLAGRRTTFDLPLRLEGSPLHRRVWERLRQIPYGATTTYGMLAAEVGAPAQAVGQAVGANPISVVVPCHRVVSSDGSLTGYAGGLDRKRALLALEEPAAADRDALF